MKILSMKSITIILLTFIGLVSQAQMPIGAWTSHITNSKGIGLCEAGDKIYCITKTGMFYYDKRDNTIQRMGKIEGMSGFKTTAIHYYQGNQSVYIGYQDGTIDIINANNRIITLEDIKRKSYPNKIINRIVENNDLLYICTGFGIVVFNPNKNEFVETYIIGDNGYENEVTDLTFDEQNIYASTVYGVKKANRNSVLPDYRVWEKITDMPNSNKKFNSIAIFDHKLIATYEGEWEFTYKTYVVDMQAHTYYTLRPDTEHCVKRLKVIDNQLMVIHKRHISFYDYNLDAPTEFIHETHLPWGTTGLRINDAIIDKDGNLWSADEIWGLVRHDYNGQQAILPRPNAPTNNSSFYINCQNNNTWMAAGALKVNGANSWKHAGLSRYKNGWWETYDRNNIPILNPVRDIIAIEPHPNNDNLIYCCSGNSGVLEINLSDKNNIKVTLNNDTTGSTLVPLYDHIVKVLEAHFDDELNLWTVSPGVNNPISVKKPNGKWQTFNYGNPNYDYGKFIITEDGSKWVIIQRGKGLFVFNENGTIDDPNDDFAKHIGVKDKNGSIISNEVFSIVQDKNGQIWVGTADGVAVFYSPQNIYSNNNNFYASRIIIDLNGKNEYLMKGKKVNSITVDGADRKWIGTEKDGVFLVSKDGQEELLHFNVENSPLPSNQIKSISIDNSSGEVFIATGGGLMSYRSDATEGLETFQDVYTFPNPVKPDYSGPITIKGLVENCIVKITDIAGNLVTEMKSLGGQAVWDGKNLNGNKVSSGVYLVLLTNENGEQKAVTKILFIN